MWKQIQQSAYECPFLTLNIKHGVDFELRQQLSIILTFFFHKIKQVACAPSASRVMELEMVDWRSKSAVAADADMGYQQSTKQQITDAKSRLHPRKHTHPSTPRKNDDPRQRSRFWSRTLRKGNTKWTNSTPTEPETPWGGKWTNTHLRKITL